jgi:tryptophan 2,3-dioxygenase
MAELTYASYLQLDTLLTLQEPRSNPPEHDEMLFIVIHQVYELWFKEMLHEVEKVKRDFAGGDLYGAIHTFKRLRTIMKSGFQSYKFRELEFVMGMKRPGMLKYAAGPKATEILKRRIEEPSLIDRFYDFLSFQGVQIPAELRNDPPDATHPPHPAVQRALLDLYKTRPEVAILFESMTDLDEGFQEWKYRHVQLVRRTIGNKHGTGGSPGVEFLKQSLFQPFFPDLWAIRHEL